MEEWKDIAGFEGFYQVSNYGRVRSLTRTQPTPNRYGGITLRTVQGAMLTPTDNGHGYKIVCMTVVGKKRKNYYVHRLVADAFVPKKESCDVINHLDHDRSNNRAENLEWCTQLENAHYSAHLMRHEKSCHRSTNTGEKYISFCKRKGIMKYRVSISRIHPNVDRSFLTLEEAIRFRNEVICGA